MGTGRWAGAGAGAYAGVLNLPLRRTEVKAKVRRAATAFAAELEQALQDELAEAVDGTLLAARQVRRAPHEE